MEKRIKVGLGTTKKGGGEIEKVLSGTTNLLAADLIPEDAINECCEVGLNSFLEGVEKHLDLRAMAPENTETSLVEYGVKGEIPMPLGVGKNVVEVLEIQ
ncbi:hypothetical protein GOBAR_DD16394 [Gossypium barbadense]|nr:hypothetical protein GOBAR_DD16394 [Gossypium barbadense]